MKKYLLFVVVLLLITCNKSPTGTDDENRLRNADLSALQWTVDTLFTENSLNTVMYTIWGASKNDVWVGGFNDNIYGIMWHYDGKKWTAWQNPGIPGLSIGEIWGFADDDIWAVGERRRYANQGYPGASDRMSLIMHYDGYEWKEILIPENDVRAGLSSIGGAGPNDMYAGGANGTLYHYDGSKWKLDSLYLPVVPNDSNGTFISSISQGSAGDDIYLLQNWRMNYAVIPYPYLYKRENEKWVLKDSSDYWYYFNNLWLSPEKNLYLTGSEVVSWTEGTGFSSISTQLPTYRSHGMAGWDDNMLVSGRDGPTENPQFFHFNGTDWVQIFALPQTGVTLSQLFFIDATVYFIVRTDYYPLKTLIYKGSF
ncbi:MAG: hypothetical protein DWQ10_06380 [Calditrichaeota bacterium]|nr:MAG: hypothetical protein DWQ10_06380 [Calditrichota bacterium]